MFLTSLFFFLLLALHSQARPLQRRASCRAASAIKKTSSTSSSAAPSPTPVVKDPASDPPPVVKQTGCFPSANFQTPDGTPTTSLDTWWCSEDTEYGFMGFSYDVGACQDTTVMTNDFKKMKSQYGARYVRLYNVCDNSDFTSNLIDAAYAAGVGLIPLDWFGFDGTTQYEGRLTAILDAIDSNPLAPYVVRRISIGSEAMFDHAISIDGLVSLIQSTKARVAKYNIAVGTSDMAYLYAQNTAVLDAADYIGSNTLPFFANDATTGSAAWPNVESDISTYQGLTKSKKILLTQTGWPSNTDVWAANTASAVASISSESEYYSLLDSKCTTFKNAQAGGIGWFAHIWDDTTLPGWGIVNGDGSAKFKFSARTQC